MARIRSAHVADMVTDDLTNMLSRVQSFRVISRQTARAYRNEARTSRVWAARCMCATSWKAACACRTIGCASMSS
jgi:hypothetical protein